MAHLKLKVDAGSASCIVPYHSALEALASLEREAAKGAQIRSRIKWVEEGETLSSNFLRLEKKRAVDRWIPALRESRGSVVSSPDGLCHTLNSFYSDLISVVILVSRASLSRASPRYPPFLSMPTTRRSF